MQCLLCGFSGIYASFAPYFEKISIQSAKKIYSISIINCVEKNIHERRLIMIELLNENESIKGSFHFPYVHMRIIDIEYED
jgi:hypothetical protein